MTTVDQVEFRDHPVHQFPLVCAVTGVMVTTLGIVELAKGVFLKIKNSIYTQPSNSNEIRGMVDHLLDEGMVNIVAGLLTIFHVPLFTRCGQGTCDMSTEGPLESYTRFSS